MPGERGVRGACWELQGSAGIAGHAGNVVGCSCWDCRVVVKRWLRSENQRATVPQRSGGPGVMGLREPGKERGGPLQALPPVPHPPPPTREKARASASGATAPKALEFYRTSYGSFHHHWEVVCVGKEAAGPLARTPTARACVCERRAGWPGAGHGGVCAMRAAASRPNGDIREVPVSGHLTVSAIDRIALRTLRKLNLALGDVSA